MARVVFTKCGIDEYGNKGFYAKAADSKKDHEVICFTRNINKGPYKGGADEAGCLVGFPHELKHSISYGIPVGHGHGVFFINGKT